MQSFVWMNGVCGLVSHASRWSNRKVVRLDKFLFWRACRTYPLILWLISVVPPHSLTLLVSTANMLEWRSFWRVCTHTHTHFRAAWCSQLNDSTVLKSRIEHVRLGLVVLLLLFAVSWLPADLLVKGRMLTICSLHADSVRIETMEWMALHLIHDKHKSITFKRNAQGNFIAFGVHFFTLGERWIKHNSNVSSSIWLYSVGTKQTQYWRNEKQT